MTDSVSLQPGTPVSLLGFLDNEPFSAIGTVYSLAPLIVETSESAGEWSAEGRYVKVLYPTCGMFESANASISGVSKFAGRTRVQLEEVEWEHTDRRSTVRYPIKARLNCRLVSESSSDVEIREFTVTTNDLSMGGVWVQSDHPAKVGSILNCDLMLSPTITVRALGVVAWADPNGRGFGVEFLDFIGESALNLRNFVMGLAA